VAKAKRGAQRADAAEAAPAPRASEIEEWARSEPEPTGDFDRAGRRYSAFWQRGSSLLGALPPKKRRSEAEAAVAARILATARASRERFLAAHAGAVYDALTEGCSRFVRLEELVFAAAALVPGLTPSREVIAAEDGLLLAEREGHEVDQGIFLAHVFADERRGTHLCHAMLLPRPEARELAPRLARDGVLDLGPARLTRRGKAVHVIASNPRFLNAEDWTTLALMETAVDVAILDEASAIAVLRGGKVEHPKYRGRHVLGAGINLTRLYRGEIPYLFYVERDLGYVHKLMRGVATPDAIPDDVNGRAVEKPWIAAVETFAIGGHCQLLLAVDFVLAAADAFMTLPARKEGIIPGAANLRLPRFVGDRIARQAIQYERRFECDSPEGRLICDEIAPPDEMDAAIDRVVAGLTNSGAVSAVANRRAFRVVQEPLDLFRRYFSVYAREQAYCHFSPALISNLERFWNAQQRKV
jgi:thioesterase DpgC